jgi:hypothetical protein
MDVKGKTAFVTGGASSMKPPPGGFMLLEQM